MSRHVSIEGLLESLRRAGVDVCILRNFHEIPASIGNDVDMVVGAADLPTFRSVTATFASQQGLRLVSVANHHHVVLTRFLGIAPDGRLRYLSIDEERGCGWIGGENLSSEEIMEAASPGKNFLTPRPAHEAVITLLTGVLIAGQVKPKHTERIATLITADGREFRRVITRAFGARLGARLESAALHGDHHWLGELAPKLRRANVARLLLRRPVAAVVHVVREVAAQLRLKLARRGLILNLVGPPGASLAAFATDVAEQLTPAFKGSPVLFAPSETRLRWPESLKMQGWVIRERLVVVSTSEAVALGSSAWQRIVVAAVEAGHTQVLTQVIDALCQRREIAAYLSGPRRAKGASLPPHRAR